MNGPDPQRRRNPIVAIGRWSRSRPWGAIALWLGFVAATLVSLQAVGDKTLQSSATGGSARGYTLLDQNHVRGILRALGVHSRLEAVAAARRYGLDV